MCVCVWDILRDEVVWVGLDEGSGVKCEDVGKTRKKL